MNWRSRFSLACRRRIAGLMLEHYVCSSSVFLITALRCCSRHMRIASGDCGEASTNELQRGVCVWCTN